MKWIREVRVQRMNGNMNLSHGISDEQKGTRPYFDADGRKSYNKGREIRFRLKLSLVSEYSADGTEERLYRLLLDPERWDEGREKDKNERLRYEKDVRPTPNHLIPTNVTFGFLLNQIVEMVNSPLFSPSSPLQSTIVKKGPKQNWERKGCFQCSLSLIIFPLNKLDKWKLH